MKLNVLTYWNKKVGFWNKPVFVEGKVEDIVEGTCRDIVSGRVDPKAHIEELDMYLLGEYDDKTAEFVLKEKPEFLVAFDTLLTKDGKASC